MDIQHLETRNHQVAEVCRFFRVNPIMIGYSDKAVTYASAEQQFLSHLVHTLMPWYSRIEQSANAWLLTAVDRRAGYYTKFTERGLLRGAMKDEAEYLSRLVERGVLTRNEARELMDRNPIDGLDEPLTPSTSPAAPPAAPTTAPEPKMRDHRDMPFQVKSVNEDGTFSGYGSVFNVVDSYQEIVVPGAFKDSLESRTPSLLWQHRSGEPIGVYTKLAEDTVGLQVEGRLALKTARGAEAYELLKMGAISGLSIGFVTREDSYDKVTGIRTLKKWTCGKCPWLHSPPTMPPASAPSKRWTPSPPWRKPRPTCAMPVGSASAKP